MKVKITSDSTCDLSAELLEKYDVSTVPLYVGLGERFGRDGVEITPADIYAYAESTGSVPTTSAVNVEDYVALFRRWVGEGYSVVHFCIGEKFSSSYRNALLAAESVGDVSVVDSANLSTGQGLLVLLAAELAAEGKSANEIVEACTAAVSRLETSFVIDSMEYLRRGGRCSALTAFGANLLKIKPCIDLIDGVLEPTHRYRGRFDQVLLQYVDQRLQNRQDVDTRRIFVVHTRCAPGFVDAVVSRVRELVPDAGEILVAEAGATITTHCGPNTLGVMFLRK